MHEQICSAKAQQQTCSAKAQQQTCSAKAQQQTYLDFPNFCLILVINKSNSGNFN